ncbi:hypothetical protein EYF80_042540 [Liparis tanakae]|uniref:Uncharacterized protein n=1 Tax=Liparis tanakae TaxID=230148 RepID=A0A4Z2G332_9TELE|nr:hypothetical protein EYF80_042540 [Liparis tanakae]
MADSSPSLSVMAPPLRGVPGPEEAEGSLLKDSSTAFWITLFPKRCSMNFFPTAVADSYITCRDLTVGEAVVAQLAQCTKGILASRADPHGRVRLHHHRGGAGHAGAVDHVGHEVQTGLEQQAVVTGEQLLVHQLLHLRDEDETCWHSLKQRQWEPSFSTKQIPQPNTLPSNAFWRCSSSKSSS